MVNFIGTDGKKTVEVSLEVYLIQSGDYISSYCPALEVSSFGLTEDEAKKAFEISLQIFLTDTHEKGTLENVLLNLGWSLKKLPVAKYQPPAKKTRAGQHNPMFIRSFNERVVIPV